jgi:hypothetical protein
MGEATVVGKIQRKVRKGQTVTTVDFLRNLQPALQNPKDRRSSSGKRVPLDRTSHDFPRQYELEIPYPVAVLTPLAIYR